MAAALEILPTTTTAVALADAGAAADQVTAQITSIPVRLITAPPRPAGPPPPPIRAQILTVPQGNAAPADVAAAAETMTAGTVTVPLADQGAAADSISAGIYPADQAAAAEALTITAVSTTLADQGAAAEQGTALVQLSTFDAGAAKDASQTTGLTQPDYGAAADALTATSPSPSPTRPQQPTRSGSSPPSARPAAPPGRKPCPAPARSPSPPRLQQVGLPRVDRPGHGAQVQLHLPWRGRLHDLHRHGPRLLPQPGILPRLAGQDRTRGTRLILRQNGRARPTASGWNFTAVGNGMRGTDFLAIYSDTWPTGQPDESINNAIAAGCRG